MSQPVDFHGGFYAIYCYCDLLRPRIVGDYFVPLLRIIPTRRKSGEFVSSMFDRIQYYPTQIKSFDCVEIFLKRDTGESTGHLKMG